MRKPFALAALCGLLAGCHAEKAAPKAEAPKRIQHADTGNGTVTVSEMADNSSTLVKKLGRDSVNNCDWFETEATVGVSNDETRAQARAAAQSEARKRAMESFLGVTIEENTLDWQQESLRNQGTLIDSMLKTTRNGRVIDEKVVVESYVDAPGCPGCQYHIQLRSCLVPVPSGSDRDFHVELELPRTTFAEGDEARIKVHAFKECYVYVYDVGMDGETSLIVPNEYVNEIHLKGGESFEYPSDDVHRRGIKLVAALPEGKDVSAETIRLVATKEPLPKDRQDPAMGGYMSLLRRLNASSIDWTDTAGAFTIYKH